MTAYRSIRRGITLIEMMVAMALALGIMLILTESFKMALDFVRGAHSTGELISQLNGAGILLTRDLQAEHFMDPKDTSVPSLKGPRLSDQRLDLPGWTPPTGGFFRIYAPPKAVEVTDAQGFNIYAPATDHQLHFTVVMPAAGDANSFTQNSGGNTYSSRAAEVAYFLAPMPGKKTSVTAGGQQLYNLIRRQRLVAVTTDEETSLTPVAGDSEVISRKVSPSAGVNTMATVMQAANRLNPLAQLTTAARFGEDIVVSNVLSFEIQADWTPGGGVAAPRAFGAGNTDAPYDFIPTANSGLFDTGNTAPPAMAARIKGLQVVIRVYDPRVKTTRQNTWKFAM